MKEYKFPIIIERDKNGYFVFCPELQGCYSQGKTYEEALVNIKDAISLHIQDRLEAREKISQIESVSLSTVQIYL